MDSLRVPIPTIDSTTDAASVYGGIIVYWTPESGTIALNDARFGRVVLEAKKLTGACVVPNELLQDSIVTFAAFMNTLFPEAIAFAEDRAFLTGTGVGEPMGVLNSPAVVSPARTGGGLAVDWADVVNCYARMLPQSLSRAVWVVAQDNIPSILQLTMAANSPVSLVASMSSGAPVTILGRPVIFTEKTPATTTLGDFAFIDFGYYLIGDRQVMTASSSEHIRFQTDETMYKIIERVDGRGWIQSAITPANGGATLSPFVVLAA
jgi:HK97 family phage major capsid protein